MLLFAGIFLHIFAHEDTAPLNLSALCQKKVHTETDLPQRQIDDDVTAEVEKVFVLFCVALAALMRTEDPLPK